MINKVKKWTKEKCFAEARKYTSKVEFKKNASGAYGVACANKWIEEMTWFKRPTVHNKKWTKEKCFEVAKKYTIKSEFRKNDSEAYYASSKLGILTLMDWFVPKKECLTRVDERQYCVYAYIDEINKSVYIGLTNNLQQRHYKHSSDCKKRKKSIVKIYFDDNNIPIPSPVVLETNLTSVDAQYYENFYINFYKNKNYNILNSGKTGIGVGSLGSCVEILTKEKCFEESKKYTLKKDFKQYSRSFYIKSVRTGWIKEMTWLKDAFLYWTYEKCMEIAKKYTNLNDFIKNDAKAYYAARRHNWLNEFKWFNIRSFWSKEDCFTEAMKYNTRYEFQRNNASAYQKALKNGWINEYIWFVNGKTPDGYWMVKENVVKESQKYKNKSEFKKKSSGAYHSALKNNWLIECFKK